MDNNIPSHKENINLWNSLIKIGKQFNLEIRHNQTNFAKFDGEHRYLILKKDAINKTIRSKDCIFFTASRNSRYYLPSIKGEREALDNLLFNLY